MHVHRASRLRLTESVVTIGAFDGVHRGHQALLRATARRARELGLPAVAYTFDPPPRAHFTGACVLSPLPDKLARLEQAGITHAVVAAFTDEYARRPPEQFVGELRGLGAVEIWVGEDFRFGARRRGDPELLAQCFTVELFPAVLCEARQAISSSRVRELLAAGAVDDASALLGRRIASA
jgi:riboflavin kinase/FMN adenylyltransferase